MIKNVLKKLFPNFLETVPKTEVCLNSAYDISQASEVVFQLSDNILKFRCPISIFEEKYPKYEPINHSLNRSFYNLKYKLNYSFVESINIASYLLMQYKWILPKYIPMSETRNHLISMDVNLLTPAGNAYNNFNDLCNKEEFNRWVSEYTSSLIFLKNNLYSLSEGQSEIQNIGSIVSDKDSLPISPVKNSFARGVSFNLSEFEILALFPLAKKDVLCFHFKVPSLVNRYEKSAELKEDIELFFKKIIGSVSLEKVQFCEEVKLDIEPWEDAT